MSEELEEQFGEFDYINDDDRGANNLIEFLKFSPNVIALVNSIMPEVQELHDAQKDVYSTINIYEAVGTQLDDIFGELLNTERTAGQTDDEYRAVLLTAIARLTQSGTITDIKAVYKSLLAANSVRLYEYQPAAFKLEATVDVIPSDEELAIISASIRTAKQAGNNVHFSITDATNTFTLGTTENIGSELGLSSDTVDGGTLATGYNGA